MSGNASTDPPPPTRPSENPTSEPDASPSTPCIAEIMKVVTQLARRTPESISAISRVAAPKPQCGSAYQERHRQRHQERRHQRVEAHGDAGEHARDRVDLKRT